MFLDLLFWGACGYCVFGIAVYALVCLLLWCLGCLQCLGILCLVCLYLCVLVYCWIDLWVFGVSVGFVFRMLVVCLLVLINCLLVDYFMVCLECFK